ncbi:rhodanese-like domain-containing protein [Pyruvatibacter sp.]|uniref:rhodanese-like domain-containing protein n=1 Tax=Pyruvatibacter sp. TaxID=1981328 RepID=UPI0032ECBC58
MTDKTLHELSPADVKARMDAGDVVVIDVREPKEYGGERIPGALNFPLSTFDAFALPTGGKEIILHCGVGKRSAMAAQKCFEGGAAEATHMAGGLGAWKQAGLPLIVTDPETGQPTLRS